MIHHFFPYFLYQNSTYSIKYFYLRLKVIHSVFLIIIFHNLKKVILIYDYCSYFLVFIEFKLLSNYHFLIIYYKQDYCYSMYQYFTFILLYEYHHEPNHNLQDFKLELNLKRLCLLILSF